MVSSYEYRENIAICSECTFGFVIIQLLCDSHHMAINYEVPGVQYPGLVDSFPDVLCSIVVHVRHCSLMNSECTFTTTVLFPFNSQVSSGGNHAGKFSCLSCPLVCKKSDERR